jgi:hypothetical protein
MKDDILRQMIIHEMHCMGMKEENPYKISMSKPSVSFIKGDEPKEPEYEGEMAKSNLYKMAKSATMLHNILKDEENLEPWVQEKIAVASSMIQSVANYLEYKKLSGD